MSKAQNSTVPGLVLNNSVTIPQLGFGVFQVPPAETQKAVEDALEAGYRHIDTAAAYRNEAGVGAAIKASGIAREELFITTKLRNGEQGRAAAAFNHSRRELGLDVIDLYLIHWPVPSQGLFVDAWKALEKIHADGGARAIGVSNFLPEHLDTLLASADVVPAVNQIELHPTFQQRELAAKSRSYGIAVEAYSPLGQGADLGSATVTELAEAHDATPAQIVLAWHLGTGNIVIPKSVHPERIRQNLAAAALQLSPEELAAISTLDDGTRLGADPAVASFSQM
ncbi:aldo/keto reductase [Arthrobacter bambusae]|uniref:aldo/keto reductase n=1 Tax=Arthrobacter TaxID=1663 RepID=UPI001F50780F|nr:MULTISPECIES: aldo/keto reductase [Arthrobacter]MCI0140261.1 aldo/keto reductase [Arthrobacter bambusae]UYY81643.1 aldo/keto reductase [Arthrobacter sp. YA7-1]